MKDININNLVRENIKELKPYQSAREEYKGDNSILLDANENPFPVGYNRYPDPLQKELKTEIGKQKGISSENIFLGNGSDEIIDLLIRAFCEPKLDSILINVPTYGMYKVCANINNVKTIEVPLNDNFQINVEQILEYVGTKIIFVCSPNNPTGNTINRDSIISLLENFNGLVVIDEAYIDFSDEPSFIKNISKYNNLIVLQTFSKARAMAGIRLGIAYANAEIIKILSKIKFPYNISVLSQHAALNSLKKNYIESTRRDILWQRSLLINQLEKFDFVQKIWKSDANFILVKFKNHDKILNYLRDNKIIVRDRSNEYLCEACLRITIGTVKENNRLISTLKTYYQFNIKTYEKNTIS